MQKVIRLSRIITISVLIFIVLFTAMGCSLFATKIGDILAEPSKYAGKELTIKGTVGETAWFALFEKGAYQLGDGSGTIWVITTQPPPKEGDSISTKGKVETAFSIGDQSYGTTLVETKRN
jgi:hypothetical protein